ncbi:mavicyanin-like [Papaver somniferum]|uniref:mavicyanin-like n=1 Tax=Papaver somniferum TaxID=3469 RepID=UPI000E7043E3|nr:mavicyanin-like [Papaver somniferum]
MGFSSKALVFFLVAMMAAASSMAATYRVGDTAGWSIMGDVDYNEWASSMTFYAGDILRFIYRPDLNNVLQVTSSDYESCTVTSPLATYLTGDDFIPILGDDDHYYFICSEPGHCEFGQKVDIQVASEVPDVSPPPPPTSTPPPPSKSSSSYLLSSSVLVGLVGAAAYLISTQ